MKRILYCLSAVFCIVASSAAVHAQASSDDFIFLKDGTEVKGKILEIVPDHTVRIRTADSSIYVYQMADVKKVTMDPNSMATVKDHADEISGSHMQQTDVVRRSFDLYIYTGLSIPRGDFRAIKGEYGGAAETGYAFGIDGDLSKGSRLSLLSSIDLLINRMNVDQAFRGSGIQAEAGSWTNVWILTGLKLNSKPAKTQGFCFGQLGMLYGTIPEITLSSGGLRATQNSASALALGYAFGAGVRIGEFMMSLRYLGGKPEYKLSAADAPSSVTTKYVQSTHCLLFTVGVRF